MPAMTLATDPRVEVHSTADKLSVAYRRVLADMPNPDPERSA